MRRGGLRRRLGRGKRGRLVGRRDAVYERQVWLWLRWRLGFGRRHGRNGRRTVDGHGERHAELRGLLGGGGLQLLHGLLRAAAGELLPELPLRLEVGEHREDVLRVAEALEERQQVEQLRVAHVVEPRGDRHRVLRVERVRGGRVVHDDQAVERAAQAPEVLHAASRTWALALTSTRPTPLHSTSTVRAVAHARTVL